MKNADNPSKSETYGLQEVKSHLDETEYGKKWPQYVAALAACLGSMCSGCCLSWSAPALPHLQGKQIEDSLSSNFSLNATQVISDEEASWIGSLVALGAIFGALPAGNLANKFGRKPLNVATAVIFLVGWILILSFGNSVYALYSSRFLQGLAIGAGCLIISIYCEEISEVSIRGTLGSFLDLMLATGILWVYVLGPFVSYQTLNISCAFVSAAYLITIIMMPETPVYLVMKAKISDAEKSLWWLRGRRTSNAANISKELLRLIKLSEKQSDLQSKKGILFRFKFLANNLKQNFKVLEIVFVFMSLQQLCGILAVTFYLEDVFIESGAANYSWLGMVVIGVTQVITVLLSSYLIERIGRIWLVKLSLAGMALNLTIMVIYNVYIEEMRCEPLFWIPVGSVALYCIFFSIGMGPVPWVLMAEILPLNIKGWVGASAVATNWLLGFIVTKYFVFILKTFGQNVTYGAFDCICVFGVFYTAKRVPETKGKSREEIQNIFKKN